MTTHIYNRAASEEWLTDPCSVSLDAENERGSGHGGEGGQSSESRTSSVSEAPYLERDPKATYSGTTTTTTSLGNEHNRKQNREQGSEQGSDENQSVNSRRSSVARNSSLELNPEGTYSEPSTPVPLGSYEKISRHGEYKCV